MVEPKKIRGIGRILAVGGIVIMIVGVLTGLLEAAPPPVVRLLITAVGAIDLTMGVLILYAARRLER